MILKIFVSTWMLKMLKYPLNLRAITTRESLIRVKLQPRFFFCWRGLFIFGHFWTVCFIKFMITLSLLRILDSCLRLTISPVCPAAECGLVKLISTLLSGSLYWSHCSNFPQPDAFRYFTLPELCRCRIVHACVRNLHFYHCRTASVGSDYNRDTMREPFLSLI